MSQPVEAPRHPVRASAEHDPHVLAARLCRARVHLTDAEAEAARVGGELPAADPAPSSAFDTWLPPIASAVAIGAVPLLLGVPAAAPFGLVAALAAAALVLADERGRRAWAMEAAELSRAPEDARAATPGSRLEPGGSVAMLAVTGVILGASLAHLAMGVSWHALAFVVVFGVYGGIVLGAAASRSRRRWGHVAARRLGVMRREQARAATALLVAGAQREVERLEAELESCVARRRTRWPVAAFHLSAASADREGDDGDAADASLRPFVVPEPPGAGGN